MTLASKEKLKEAESATSQAVDKMDGRSSGTRIFKNVATQGLTYGIRAASGFLIIVFIARLAGAESLGLYSFTITFTMAAAFLTDLGIGLLLIREIARDRTKASKYINNTFTLMFLLAPVVLLLLITAVNFLDYPSDRAQAVYLAAIALVLFGFTTVFKGAFFARERMEFWTATIAAQESVLLVVGLVVLYLGLPFLTVFVVYALSRLVGLLVAWAIYRWSVGSIHLEFDKAFTRRLIRLSFPFAAAMVLNLLYARSAILLLTRFQGDEATGYYEAAYNLSIRLVLLSTMINIAILPSLARFHRSQHGKFITYVNQATRYTFVIGIPLVLCLFLLAEQIIPFLYSAEFMPSIPALRVLLVAVLFKMLGHTYATSLTATDKQGLRATAVGLVAALNIALNLFLIPRISFVGAAIAAVLTEVSLFLLFLFFSRKFAGTQIRLSLAWKPVLATIPMIGVIFLSKDLPLLATLGLALTVYGLFFILMRGLAPHEVAAVRQLFQVSFSKDS